MDHLESLESSADIFAPPGEINYVKWSILSSEKAKSNSHVTLTNFMSHNQRKPVSGGPHDPRMGSERESILCNTCRKTNQTLGCLGHPGDIALPIPIPNPSFASYIIRWLKRICWSCGGFLKQIDQRFRSLNADARWKALAVKNVISCPHCKAKVYNVKPHPGALYCYLKMEAKKETKTKGAKFTMHDDWMALSFGEIYQIFSRVSDRSVELAGFKISSHPKHLMMTTLSVMPNCSRPDMHSPDKRIRANDSTTMYGYIQKFIMNSATINAVNEDMQANPFESNLAAYVFALINGPPAEKKGNESTFGANERNLMSISGRLPGKSHGRFRQNLCGKRVRATCRSVIVGDPRIPVGTVGVPLDMAKKIPIMITVQDYNKEEMTKIFNNGTKVYPGCSLIIRKDTGNICGVDSLPENYRLKNGDVLMCALRDGNYVNYNRQPTLSISGMAGYKVRVVANTSTLKMGPESCIFHGADFDGDCMSIVIAQDIMPENEVAHTSSVLNWICSIRTGYTTTGSFQDSVMGHALLTSEHTGRIHRNKAMAMFANIKQLGQDNPLASMKFDKKYYTARELVSRILPAINYKAPAKIYNEAFAPYFKYYAGDINVEIRDGELISGMLDADAIGQGVKNGVVHLVYNTYGPHAVISLLYNITLMSNMFLHYTGFSVGWNNLRVKPETRDNIRDEIAKIMFQSRQLTEKIHTGELRPPAGITVREYYEDQQIKLQKSLGDVLYKALADIDLYENELALLMATGSKGKLASNLLSLICAVGLMEIDGHLIVSTMGGGRSSPYFHNADPDPRSMGFIPTSFSEGIEGKVFIAPAAETRRSLATQALLTAITGTFNRNGIKNSESMVMDSTLACRKHNSLIQSIYGGTGMNPRVAETTIFPTVSCDYKEFKNLYEAKSSQFAAKYRNKVTDAALEAEFAQLEEDRNEFRFIFKTVEENNVFKAFRMNNKRDLPININRIIASVKKNSRDSDAVLDPVAAIARIKKFCDNYHYLYTNQAYAEAGNFMPPHFVKACTASRIATRAYLCTRELLRLGLNNDQLELVLQQIVVQFKHSLMNFGCSPGILAAQCVSDPFTQFILDSKHRSGAGGGTKTNALVRFGEILKAFPTARMQNPMTFIFLEPEIEMHEDKVKKIANEIEMTLMKDIVEECQIFYEKIGEPQHPRYKHEAAWINQFVKKQASKSPRDLENYCLRFVLNKEKLVLKNLEMRTIQMAIMREFPHLYQVYTDENSDLLVLRLYPTQSSFKKAARENMRKSLQELLQTVKDTKVRGIQGIISTTVRNHAVTVMDEKDAISSKNIFSIIADGTNMPEILLFDGVDPTRTQTDSVIDMIGLYGIECGRATIMAQLQSMIPTTDIAHYTVYADMMTHTGNLTNNERAGTAKREYNNIFQRASFGDPKRVIRDAALKGVTDHINGVSGPLCVGAVPRVGTLFADVLVDHEFMKNNKFTDADAALIEEIDAA